MNQQEYDALDDLTLSHSAVTLYVRGFRRFMNYETGNVAISLVRLSQILEFVPPQGSTKVMVKPTKANVRHLVDTLHRHGLIRCIKKGDITTRSPAIFHCTLATFSNKQVFSDQNHEQHESNTGTTREQNHRQPAPHIVNTENVLNFPKGHEQHRSAGSDKSNVCNARAMHEISYTEPFIQIAKRCQLASVSDDDTLVFKAFQSSPRYRHKLQSDLEYQADWQSFCAYWVANRQANVKNTPVKSGAQHASHPQRQNASAAEMQRSKAAAQRNAEHGIDIGILDQSQSGP